MASTDDQILELNDTILSRDTTIGLRDATIASKDDVISQRNNLIAEQNATILTQGDSITELQNRVSELESSPNELRELIDERWTEIDWTDPGAKDAVSALWSEVKEAAQAKGYGNEKLGELASWIAALVVGSGESAGTPEYTLITNQDEISEEDTISSKLRVEIDGDDLLIYNLATQDESGWIADGPCMSEIALCDESWPHIGEGYVDRDSEYIIASDGPEWKTINKFGYTGQGAVSRFENFLSGGAWTGKKMRIVGRFASVHNWTVTGFSLEIKSSGITRGILETLAEGTGVTLYTVEAQISEADVESPVTFDIKKTVGGLREWGEYFLYIYLNLEDTTEYEDEGSWWGNPSVKLVREDIEDVYVWGIDGYQYRDEAGCECRRININSISGSWLDHELKVFYRRTESAPWLETKLRITITKKPLSDLDIVLAAAANPKAAEYEADVKYLAVNFNKYIYWNNENDNDDTTRGWEYERYKEFISDKPRRIIEIIKNKFERAGYDKEKIYEGKFDESFKTLFRYAKKSINYCEDRLLEETTTPEKVSGPVLISYWMHNGQKATDEELTEKSLTNWENANWTPQLADGSNWATDTDRTLFGIYYVKSVLGIEPEIEVYLGDETYTAWDEFYTKVCDNRDYGEAWYRVKVDLSSVTMYDVSGLSSNNTDFIKDTDSDPESDEARRAFRVSDLEIVVRQEWQGYYSEDKHCNQILNDVDRGTVTHVWFADDREGDITAVKWYNKKFYGGCLNDLAELTGVTLEDGESESDSEYNVRKIADAVRALKQE